MDKQETIKYLTDLMATIQGYYFKGRLHGSFQVEEEGGAAISLPLYVAHDDDVEDFGPQFHLADADAKQEPIRIFRVTYDPDDEKEPLMFRAFFGDVCIDGFDIAIEQIPVEALVHIVKWVESRFKTQEEPEPAGPVKFDNQVTSFMFYMWNRWCEEECKEVFGKDDFWPHFWKKWCAINGQYGRFGAVEHFYAELSDHNRDKLVKRAMVVC